jgi:hypothetical protein
MPQLGEYECISKVCPAINGKLTLGMNVNRSFKLADGFFIEYSSLVVGEPYWVSKVLDVA